MVLTNKVGTEATRLWYAAQAIEHGWSRNVLEHHIGSLLHTRVDRSPTPARIPVAPVDSELVTPTSGLPSARRQPHGTSGPSDDIPAGRAQPRVRHAITVEDDPEDADPAL